jgi:hypothetical protein
MTTPDPTTELATELATAEAAVDHAAEELKERDAENARLRAEVERLRRATDHHCANTERELERLRPVEQRAREVAAMSGQDVLPGGPRQTARYILGEA